MAPPLFTGAALLPEKVLLVTVSVASLKMAPPLLEALLPEKVLSVTVSMPSFKIAPPPGMLSKPAKPLAMVRFWTVNGMPEFTTKTCTVPPPLMVITPPPSMVLSALMVFVPVTVIVAAPPQAKVTVPSKLPPPGRQASNIASVQVVLVPVPTTHATADEVAANTAKTSGARTAGSRLRTVVVFIACLPCGEARPLPPWDRSVPRAPSRARGGCYLRSVSTVKGQPVFCRRQWTCPVHKHSKMSGPTATAYRWTSGGWQPRCGQ